MPTLNWIGKNKIINHHKDIIVRDLDLKYTYSGQNNNNSSDNKIIHGDNLEALKAIMPEYKGRVKCIYIDPPYNTGNEHWVYNDNINDPKINKWLGQVVGKETEDLSRHDKWLCMIYPRIQLLHNLLAEDGAIFISIDDNEQANLRLVCDEIFGNTNFITNIIWEKNYSPRNDANFFSASHDFILVYAKNKNKWNRNLSPRTDKQNKYYKHDDGDGRGLWRADNVLVKSFSKSGVFSITNPNTGEEHFPPKGNCYRFNEQKAKELLADNRLYFGKKGTGKPQLKRYLSEVNDGVVPQTIWKYDEVSHNQEAKKELNKIIKGNVFDSPKPTLLIEKIIKIATNDNDIILDSFAGSGTTAQAVLNVNKEQKTNRRFILVEMEDYANSITAERIKRVIDGYDDKQNNATGGSFNYYKLGKPLFTRDYYINPEVEINSLKKYIWISETNERNKKFTDSEHKFLLGNKQNTAYYFYYIPNKNTILNQDFLSTIKTAADNYVIYANNCLLSEDFMNKYNIKFKKIPRDIKKL